jgi:PAS domain S-box-containing protein
MAKDRESLAGLDASSPGTQGASVAPVEPPLQFNEARCAALMRVLTSIVWVTDADGRFVEPQLSWSHYTGQAWPAQSGYGWMEAVHPDDRAQVQGAIEHAIRAGTLYSAALRLWHAATHTYRRVEARGVPILDDSGRLQEWIGTCRDVEDQIKAEDVVRNAERRKDEFIAILSHELRNPLAPIRNAVQVLKRRAATLPDMQLTWVCNVVERQVSHMSHLLEDLLDLSRIGQNKLILQKVWVSLDSVLDDTIEASRPLCEQYGHRLEVNALSDAIYLEADPRRLVQVFTNLLNNAAKYTERGGRIALTLKRDAGMAVVEVEDNGIGISPEMLPRVFDLFAQDRPTLERSQGGLGIGLSIVRALVERHGGSVQVFSEGSGRGSRFTVRLPAADRRSVGAHQREVRTSGAVSLRILVADDNADAAETLAVLLEMEGHVVRVVADGEEAVETARRFQPDVALLDIGMPKLNGYEVASALRRADAARPVLVAITGWGQRDDLRRAADAGFDHHLVKPVDADKLLGLIGRIGHPPPPS